jgi:thiamine-phosphate pyrophosphorylase
VTWTPPALYAILDVDLAVRHDRTPLDLCDAWLEAGVRLIQLRAKSLSFGPMLALADQMAARTRAAGATLVINDRADVARLAGADGVHVGQGDLGVVDVRAMVGAEAIVGVSTHSEAQVRAAAGQPISYLAIGPVFETETKARPDPVVGLDGVRAAAAVGRAAGHAIVAIGGITLERAGLVLAAGADAVAVASDLTAPDPLTRAQAWMAAIP